MTTDKESNAEFVKRANKYIRETPSTANWDKFQDFVLQIGKQHREALDRLSAAAAKIGAQQKCIRDDLAAAIESIVGHLVSEHNTQNCPKSCAVCFFIDLGKAAIAKANEELK
jgi:hypothetical protein